jgi:hypothetical protein
MTILLSRRRLVAGLVGLVAAPAVVRAASLMPVKPFALLELERPSDMLFTMVTVREKIGNWPYTAMSAIYHRRDLADLGEPYRSQVLTRRRLGA